MSNYQAVFDAVREAFGQVDHYMACAVQDFCLSAAEQARPCAVFRPNLSIDGNQWCALYGENLQDGVAGFGDTPAKAMADFDSQWLNAKTRGAA